MSHINPYYRLAPPQKTVCTIDEVETFKTG